MILYQLFQHIGLKVLALGLAVLLWLTITGEPIVERGLRVPLEFQNIPDGLELIGEAPTAVDVRVRGSSAILSRLAPGDVVAVLDLRAARPGRRLFHLLSDQVRAPYGVDVAQVQPPTIALAIERSGARTVPVVPDVEGDPAPGYVVSRASSEPATVEVIGPESRLRQVTEAITEPVSVAGRAATVREQVTIGVPDTSLRLRQPQSAVVTVEIVPAPIERTFGDLAVRARNVAGELSAQIVPGMVAVSVRGSRDAMRRLDIGAIDAFVDLAGLGAGRYNLPVRVEPAPDVGVSRIEPATVQVRIK